MWVFPTVTSDFHRSTLANVEDVESAAPFSYLDETKPSQLRKSKPRSHTTKSHLKLVTPATENRTVAPRRRRNAELRTREYLTDAEVGRLQDAAKANRWGHRDATMILVAYRHGLRTSELVDLRWNQVDFEAAALGHSQGEERDA